MMETIWYAGKISGSNVKHQVVPGNNMEARIEKHVEKVPGDQGKGKQQGTSWCL
ncbi:hypothetical protein PM082_019230 [Marasmius tenuissimus]|nr:hypothetical protein PM082_019230 [Marasmius tenuissimus]